jgi:hypothetical protein
MKGLGEGLGCAFIILACGIAFYLFALACTLNR